MCGGGQSSVSTTTPIIPDELRPLFSSTANLIQGFQPQAQSFFTALGSQPPMQVAGMSPLEQMVQSGAGLGMERATSIEPGFYQAFRAMNLDPTMPLGQLAATPTGITPSEVAFGAIIPDMESVMRTTVPQTEQEIAAQQALYQAMGLSGGTVGRTPEELAAFGALQQLPGVAGTQVQTPQAETQALALLNSLTGGNVGSSPATQQAIDFLEHQYETRTLPTLQNQLAQAGLGRSGALGTSINDARAQLLGAEVPLLQQEIANRAQATSALGSIAAAQAARGSEPIARTLQALQAQAGGMTGLGGQVASRQQADLDRMVQTMLAGAGGFQSLGGQLAGRTEDEITRQLQTEQGLLQMLLPAAQFQRENQLLPIQRQIDVAMGSAAPYSQISQGQVDMGTLAATAGQLPREIADQQSTMNLQQNLRQQALLESITTGILGNMIPSSFGSQVMQTGGGAGMFGK